MPGITPEGILYGSEGDQYGPFTTASWLAPASTYPTMVSGSSTNVATGKTLPLGVTLVLQDGRRFRYASVGASNLVVGNVVQAAVPISTDYGMTPAAGTIGDRLITFTHGAATTIANYFKEGYAVISVTPGGGDTYVIDNHLALASAVAGDVVNLASGHALRRALTTTSRLDLIPNPFFRVVQAPITTLTAAPVGVAVSTALASGFGFLQTKGAVGVLTNGTVIIGEQAITPAGAAGAVGPNSAGGAEVEVIVGRVLKVSASGAWSTIMLDLD